jgi:hypothetical protein
MATLAYLTAPWSQRVVRERHWRLLPLSLFCTWVTVDVGYAIYWYCKDPAALAFMRDARTFLRLFPCAGCAVFYGSIRDR